MRTIRRDMRYLIIAIACLAIAMLASTGFTAEWENYFFHMDKTTIEESQPIIEMEPYERADAWDEEGNVTESTTCMRLKSSTPNTVYRDAYVAQSVIAVPYQHCLEETYDGEDEEGNHIDLIDPQCTLEETRYSPVTVPVEMHNAVKVGEYAGKDIIHVVSDNEAIKGDPGYLGQTYSGLQSRGAHGQSYHDAVHETVYEVEEMVEGELTLVRKRIKTKKWKDRGRPEVKISEGNKPHKWVGVAVD